MKIKYEFVTEKIEIEIDSQWDEILEELEKVEKRNNHNETRRHVWLDTNLDSSWLASIEDEPCEKLEKDTEIKELMRAIESLNDKQRDVIEEMYFNDIKGKEYAKTRGITQAATTKRKQEALKNLKKFLKKG